MKDVSKHWEHFSHMADIGVRGMGATIEEAFEMAAIALTQVITDIALIQPLQELSIQCNAPNLDILFFDWMNALIYEMDTRQMLFSHFKLCLQGLKLQATIKGEAIDRPRHVPVVDVKGATFTELKIVQTQGMWMAQCVVDV